MYWPHVTLPISIVSCAFATTGITEIAKVKQINPRLIVIVLQEVYQVVAYDCSQFSANEPTRFSRMNRANLQPAIHLKKALRINDAN
jgi:hypothetical protein